MVLVLVHVGGASLARRIAGAVAAPGRQVDVRDSLRGMRCDLAIVSGDSVEELDTCDTPAALVILEAADEALHLKLREGRVRGLIDRDESDRCVREAAESALRKDGLFALSFSLVPVFRKLAAATYMTAGLPSPLPGDRLTPREREVIPFIGAGFSNRSIAQRMFVTEPFRVRVHDAV